uniref:ADP-ribosylation factor-like protein 2-binding protein isoform X2 n=1 Tax=Myxine glutinosa TaxID=7769 RepID=UPI00359010D1
MSVAMTLRTLRALHPGIICGYLMATWTRCEQGTKDLSMETEEDGYPDEDIFLLCEGEQSEFDCIIGHIEDIIMARADGAAVGTGIKAPPARVSHVKVPRLSRAATAGSDGRCSGGRVHLHRLPRFQATLTGASCPQRRQRPEPRRRYGEVVGTFGLRASLNARPGTWTVTNCNELDSASIGHFGNSFH